MNILGVSGSLRSGSYNSLLLKAAAEIAKESGSTLTLYPLDNVPLYNRDLDGEQKPAGVETWITAIASADGMIIATPEYNYSMPGVLKNALDWASRPAFKSVLAGKPTGVVSASMSPLGGARAQVHLRDVLAGTLTPLFQTPDYLLGLAQNAFDERGQLTDEKARERLKRFVLGYIEWASDIDN